MLANSILQFLSRKLPISRLQRDLTDSTVLRNVGVAFGYTLIGLKSLHEGLLKLEVNQKKMESDLHENCSVVAEGIQTRLKILGVENSYETFKELTRNHDSSEIPNKIVELVNSLDIDDSEKKYLNTITPLNYTGIYKL